MTNSAKLTQIRQTLRLKPAQKSTPFSLFYLHIFRQGSLIPQLADSTIIWQGQRHTTTFQLIRQAYSFYNPVALASTNHLCLAVAIPQPFTRSLPSFNIRPKNSLHSPVPQQQYLLPHENIFSAPLLLTLDTPAASNPLDHCSPRLWSLVKNCFNELIYTENHLLFFVAKPSPNPTVYELEWVIRLALAVRSMINQELDEKQFNELEPQLTYAKWAAQQRPWEFYWLADLFNWRYQPEEDLLKELRRLLAETTQQKAFNLVRGEFEHTPFLLFDHFVPQKQTVVAIQGHSNLPSFQLTPAGFTTWLRQKIGGSFIQSDRLPKQWAVQTFEKEPSRNQLLEKLPTSSWQKIGSPHTVVRHDGFWYVYFVPGQLQPAESLLPFIKQAVTFYKELQRF